MTLDSLLTKITKLCEASSYGKWEVEDYRAPDRPDWRSTGVVWARNKGEFHPGTNVCRVNCDRLHSESSPELIAEFEANAAFIAEARTLLPLLAQVCREQQEALVKASNVQLDHHGHPLDDSDAINSMDEILNEAQARIAKLIQGAGGAE